MIARACRVRECRKVEYRLAELVVGESKGCTAVGTEVEAAVAEEARKLAAGEVGRAVVGRPFVREVDCKMAAAVLPMACALAA